MNKTEIRAITAIGRRLIIPSEVTFAYPRVVYSTKVIRHLLEKLPPNEVLEYYKYNECVLVPAPPRRMSLLSVRKIGPQYFFSKNGALWADDRFASEEETSPGWIVLKKVPSSVDPTGVRTDNRDMYPLLLNNMLTVVDFVWAVTVYSFVREKIFESDCVRTLSRGLDNKHIIVGMFNDDGLAISHVDNRNIHQYRFSVGERILV